MPLIHDNNQPLSTKDALAMQDLLKGSLNSIVKKLEATKKTFKKKQNPGALFDPIIKTIMDGIDSLKDKTAKDDSLRSVRWIPRRKTAAVQAAVRITRI